MCMYIQVFVQYVTMYVCTYVLTCSTRKCTHMKMLQTHKYVHFILFNGQRILDIERARAEEIATPPPPKQEIDMVCVCTYLCTM